MRYLVGGLLIFGLSAAVYAQPGQSLGGFGSVLHPGGNPPPTPPGGVTGPYFFGPGAGRGAIPSASFAGHPSHRRTTIVPYPVYYGGYAYPYGYGYGSGYDPSAGYPPPAGYTDPSQTANSNGLPSVVINQNFVPPIANPQVRDYVPPDTSQDQQQQQSGMKLYQAPAVQPAPQQARRDDQPTLYLIAFKDHTIVQALGYWMEGSTLHYVSAEQSLNQVSISLVDRDLSQRLNDERGVEFKLPQAR